MDSSNGVVYSLISATGIYVCTTNGSIVRDSNNNLHVTGDVTKEYDIVPTGITYYNPDGTANVALTTEGTELFD
jgi:hypothetical protein